jgi:hypothetical protein
LEIFYGGVQYAPRQVMHISSIPADMKSCQATVSEFSSLGKLSSLRCEHLQIIVSLKAWWLLFALKQSDGGQKTSKWPSWPYVAAGVCRRCPG